MSTGVIKKLVSEKAFGFITPTQYPRVDFTIAPKGLSLAIGTNAIFTDISTCAAGCLRRVWTFGDGTGSTGGPVVTHPYTMEGGPFTPTLTVTDRNNHSCTKAIGASFTIDRFPKIREILPI